MRLREQIEKREDEALAPWAVRVRSSQGRLHDEADHAYRTAFQRDRDRVLHSRAFRRLQHKTQVLPYPVGDHYRNRLTHTLEVAQIGRTVARALGLNEDLTEAIVLAHDIGHPPFGHAGERVLHDLMREHGGFEHNRQSLRIVDLIEVRSDRYTGLNLTQETRAGLLKHGSAFPHPLPLPSTSGQPCLEAQIANLADEVAYHTHDIDDGLRSGLLDWEHLSDLSLWRRALERAQPEDAPARRALRPQVTVQLIDILASDLIEATSGRLGEQGISSAEQVRAAAQPLAGFSAEVRGETREAARFLMRNFYRHEQVIRMAAKAERILRDLWAAYTAEPGQVPPRVLERAEAEPLERVLADYVAGMTDRFAMDEHRKLFDPHAPV